MQLLYQKKTKSQCSTTKYTFNKQVAENYQEFALIKSEKAEREHTLSALVFITKQVFHLLDQSGDSRRSIAVPIGHESPK